MTGAPLPEPDDLLAAELAFGLLDGDDRRDAEARIAADPAFAAAHDRWAEYAAGLLAGADVAPPPSLWSRIEQRRPQNDVAPATPANAAVRWWQAATFAASAIAAVLAAMIVGRAPPIAPPPAVVQVAPASAGPQLVAILTGEDRRDIVTISFDRATGRLLLAPARLDPDGRTPELWIIPADEVPRSLGVIAAAAPSQRNAPVALAPLLAPGSTLAVSLEPAGGSPSGAPTGPVILTGKITPI